MGAATGRQVWRILVVDDEENLNWSLVTSLRRDSYAADGALTGEDALRRLANQAYDIVISDVKMPGMDGFELLQWLRTYRPQTRVVMMTAFGSPTDRAEALRGGVIAYLEKPFDLRALKEELRRLTTGGQQSGGTGEAEGYDLLEVARVINLARRDIALAVEASGRTGRLRFLRGDLIWAEADDLQGNDAFVALTAPRNGRVQPEPWDGRSSRNVTEPLSRLIYLALIQRDRAPHSDTAGGGRWPSAAQAPGQPTTPAVPAQAAAAPVPLAPDPAAPFEVERAATPPSTAILSPLSPAQVGAVRAVLDEVAGELPEQSGAVLLRPDGAVVTQRWVGAEDAPAGALTHLAASAQATLRALLLTGWGDLEDVHITSVERHLLMRRLGRTDRAAVLLLVLPRTADIEDCRATLRRYEPDLLDALR